MTQLEHENTRPSPLLGERGRLVQVGWARQPVLDCNLEQARFYRIRPLQRLRIKRWDLAGLPAMRHPKPAIGQEGGEAMVVGGRQGQQTPSWIVVNGGPGRRFLC